MISSTMRLADGGSVDEEEEEDEEDASAKMAEEFEGKMVKGGWLNLFVPQSGAMTLQFNGSRRRRRRKNAKTRASYTNREREKKLIMYVYFL